MPEIPLGHGIVALLDVEDVPLVAHYKWHLSGSYAQAYTPDGPISMHSLVVPEAVMVDHINGDGLDNRRSNLRPATPSQNQWNKKPVQGTSSRYKGVCWKIDRQKWQAYIRINYKRIYLGCFDDEVEAARAYDVAALEHFGEFARLNFPDG